MAQSEQYKSTIRLGKRIVEELNLTDSSDTLSRWMAHHLSDLMIRIEGEVDSDKKNELQKECSDLILKIWDRRDLQISGIDTLKDLIPTLEILAMFKKEDRRSLMMFSNDISETSSFGKFASSINKIAPNIIEALLILSLLPDKIKLAKDWKNQFEEVLSDEEKKIIGALESFLSSSTKFKFIINGNYANETDKEETYIEYILSELETNVEEINDSFEAFAKSVREMKK